MRRPVRTFERLERIAYRRCDVLQVGNTLEEIAAAAEWVRSLGHEAETITEAGFRYRSVYPEDSAYAFGEWYWVCAGQWLFHNQGEGQDPELDSPHDGGPDPEESSYRFNPEIWHEVTPPRGLGERR